MKRFAVLLTIFSLSLPAVITFAGPFSDVPDDHPYAAAMQHLKDRGIMKGNPDGTGAPERHLNRAELLALLYRATNRTPRAVHTECFTDFGDEAWFASLVCDAAAEGFVSGYPNHTFQAGNDVIRVEFFKMLLNVLGFTVPELSQEDKLSIDFLGPVTSSSWYAPYLHRVLALKLVPESFTLGNNFDPGLPVLRGEAAEMIDRALNTEDIFFQEVREKQSSSSRTEEEEEEETATPTGATLVPFPIHRTGETGERGTSSFAFDFSAPGTVLVEAHNLGTTGTGVSCYLYLLSEAGFTNEFFVGYEYAGGCFIRAALRAGRYQLEVRTKTKGEEFSLDAEPSSGDGNDGFIEAINLRTGSPRAGVLHANDYEDWFRFTVQKVEKREVRLSTSAALHGTIFPGDDVDQFGEQGPRIGSASDYQPGTYYVSVKRKGPPAASLSYTVELR